MDLAFWCNKGADTPSITAHDKIVLTWWEKWAKYGKFPWKFVFHLALLTATTTQIVIFNKQDATYFRALQRTWYYYFFPEDFDFSSKTYYLYTVKETLDSISRAVTGLEKAVNTSIDKLNYTYTNGVCDQCRMGHLQVTNYLSDMNEIYENADTKKESSEYSIGPGNLGPFSGPYANTSRLMRRLVNMDLKFSLTSYGPSGHICVVWDISLHYDFQHRGQIALDLRSGINRSCDGTVSISDFVEREFWLNLIILPLAVGFFILSLKSIADSARILLKLRRQRASKGWREQRNGEQEHAYLNSDTNNIETRSMDLGGGIGLQEDSSDERAFDYQAVSNGCDEDGEHEGFSRRADAESDYDPWEELSFWDKLRFFNFWFLSTAIATVCLLVHSILNLIYNMKHSPTNIAHKFFAGLGCGLLWVNLIAYLSGSGHYYTLIHTLNRAIPRVFRFLVGVVPVFLGYAFFGMLYFGDKSDRFQSFSVSLITLFALLNGDEIRETFMDLVYEHSFVAQVYVYSFVCLFIYVVLNVFIAIVEESFFATRAKARSMELFARDLANKNANDTKSRTSLDLSTKSDDDDLKDSHYFSDDESRRRAYLRKALRSLELNQ